MAVDPISGERVLLFNPVRQDWESHFRWSTDSTQIIGLTPVGRATIIALQLNRATLVHARALWREAGWHPSSQP